jgi:parallel beta-helix repeat protein
MLATPQPVWATGPSTAGQEASGPDPEAPPTLYVSPEGDDGAAGTSPEAALATLEAALARAGSGDGIYLLPGVYAQSSYLEEVFDPENPLWIAGEPGASILDGGGELPYALWCEACAGIVLRDLVIRNYTDACVALIASEAIAFERVEIAGCGFAPALTEAEFEGYGFYVEGSQAIAVEDSEVHHNGPNPQRPGFLVGTAVNLYACSGCLVRGNRIHNNVGAAVLAEDSHDVVIEDNQIFGNELDVTVEQWWDGAIWIDGGANVVVRGNALYGNNGPALQISDEEGAGPTGYVVEGNAITGNRIGVYLWGFGTWEMPEQPVLRFEGNTLEANELGDVFVYPEWCLPPEGCG